MADENKIKQRIELEGEKEYNAALAEARRNLKTLRSELKAETAELGSNATAQQKAEVRTKNLQKQIKEQEKVVKTYQNALKEVKEKYGDNEEAVAKWEQKLNEARATLANLKNSLDDVGEGMKGVETSAQLGVVATNSFADSLGKIADVGNSVSTAIENAFMNVVGFVSDAISELWSQLMEVSARANNWTDIATMWNSSAGTIQKWYHAVSGEGKEFARLTNYVTKIVTGDQKKIAEASLVSAETYSDQWEYAMAVMDSLADMDTTKQIEALKNMGINGAKQEGWLDMLKAWNDIQENASKFDAQNGGLGLTDEELEKANQLAIDVAMLQTSWQALKDHALVNLFGDISLSVTGNLQKIVEAFDEYFKAEDDAGRNEALQKIKDNIVEIFTNIANAIKEGIELLDKLAQDLQSSDNATARTIGDVLSGIVSALDWFTKEENWSTVVAAFEALIGVWAAGKIVGAIANIASFGSHLATISSFFGWGKGKDTGTGGGNGTGVGGPDVIATGGSFSTAIKGIVAKAVSTITSAIGMFGAAGDMFINQTNAGRALRDGRNLLDGIVKDIAETKRDIEKNADTFAEDWANNVLVQGASKMIEDWKLNGQNTIDYWFGDNGIFKILKRAEEYADEQNAEEPQHVIVEPDENGYFPDWASWEDIQQYYENQEKLMNEMLNNSGANNIDAEWWEKGNASLTSEDLSGFRSVPGLMKAAVREGVSGIKVVLDGQAVGNLVASYVSQQIARNIL